MTLDTEHSYGTKLFRKSYSQILWTLQLPEILFLEVIRQNSRKTHVFFFPCTCSIHPKCSIHFAFAKWWIIIFAFQYFIGLTIWSLIPTSGKIKFLSQSEVLCCWVVAGFDGFSSKGFWWKLKLFSIEMCYTRRGRQISELMTSYIEAEYLISTGNYLLINFKTLVYTKINLFFPPQVNPWEQCQICCELLDATHHLSEVFSTSSEVQCNSEAVLFRIAAVAFFSKTRTTKPLNFKCKARLNSFIPFQK